MTPHGSTTAQMPLPTSPRDFVDFAASYTGAACLLWPFAKLRNGYGAAWNGKVTTASRVVCERVHGPAPVGYDAAHNPECVSRLCVNGRHLRWATRSANNLDQHVSGTAKGVLSVADATAIKAVPLAYGSGRALAAVYGVSEGHISNIRHGRDWSWLP